MEIELPPDVGGESAEEELELPPDVDGETADENFDDEEGNTFSHCSCHRCAHRISGEAIENARFQNKELAQGERLQKVWNKIMTQCLLRRQHQDWGMSLMALHFAGVCGNTHMQLARSPWTSTESYNRQATAHHQRGIR